MFKPLSIIAATTLLLTACTSTVQTNTPTLENDPTVTIYEWFRAISDGNAERATTLIRPDYPMERWELLTNDILETSIKPHVIYIEKIDPQRLNTSNTVVIDVEYVLENIAYTFTETFTAEKNETGWTVRGGYVDIAFPNIDSQLIPEYVLNGSTINTENMFNSLIPDDTYTLPLFPGIYNISTNNNPYFTYEETLTVPNSVSDDLRNINTAQLDGNLFTPTTNFTTTINNRLNSFTNTCLTNAQTEQKQYPCSTVENSQRIRNNETFTIQLLTMPKVVPQIVDNQFTIATTQPALIAQQRTLESTNNRTIYTTQTNSPNVELLNYSFDNDNIMLNFAFTNYIETEQLLGPTG